MQTLTLPLTFCSQDDTGSSYLQEATEYLSQFNVSEFLDQNYGNSVETLSQAIELDPNHKLALMSRGTGYMKYEARRNGYRRRF